MFEKCSVGQIYKTMKCLCIWFPWFALKLAWRAQLHLIIPCWSFSTMEKNLTKRLPTKSIIHYRHNLNIIKYNIRYNTTNTHETSFVHTENANTIQNTNIHQTWFDHCTILPFGVNLDGNTALCQRFNRSLAGCIGELEGGWGLERWFGQSWFGCQMIHTHFSRPNIVQLYKRESDGHPPNS